MELLAVMAVNASCAWGGDGIDLRPGYHFGGAVSTASVCQFGLLTAISELRSVEMNKKTVLIADDDRDIVRVLSLGLRAKGFNILIAFDVMQAMMAVRKTPPDAILLDINMPGGGGLEALKNLKSSTTSGLIPVIIITANADPELRKTAMEMGADAFFNKPFDLEEVHRTLVQVLDKPQESPPKAD